MEYTHTFEIIVDGINVQGEILFHNGQSSFKTDFGEEMTIIQHGKIQSLLENLCQFCRTCGEIQKLEVIKK